MFDGFEPHHATLCVSQYIKTVNASLLVLFMSSIYVYRVVKVADRRFSDVWVILQAVSFVVPLCMTLYGSVSVCVLRLCVYMQSSIILYYIWYCTVSSICLISSARYTTATLQFLYSICSYHQMCIFILFFHQQRLRITPSLDLV